MTSADPAPFQSIATTSPLRGGAGIEDEALTHALRLACGGALHVFHVDPDDAEGYASIDTAGRLARWSAAAGAPLAAEVQLHRLVSRDPVNALVEAVVALDPDVLVMGTHGHGALVAAVRGRVAEPVARGARETTLFLPEGARGFVDPDSGRVRMRRVLVPVDHHPGPARQLQQLARLLRTLDVREVDVRLVHIGTGAFPECAPPEVAGWRFTQESVGGELLATIVDMARDWQADLVAMGTRGHEGVLDSLFGSTVERVVRQADCPVLTVPS
jgi:nucleotide-binding universal stress UspA family protein